MIKQFKWVGEKPRKLVQFFLFEMQFVIFKYCFKTNLADAKILQNPELSAATAGEADNNFANQS